MSIKQDPEYINLKKEKQSIEQRLKEVNEIIEDMEIAAGLISPLEVECIENNRDLRVDSHRKYKECRLVAKERIKRVKERYARFAEPFVIRSDGYYP